MQKPRLSRPGKDRVAVDAFYDFLTFMTPMVALMIVLPYARLRLYFTAPAILPRESETLRLKELGLCSRDC